MKVEYEKKEEFSLKQESAEVQFWTCCVELSLSDIPVEMLGRQLGKGLGFRKEEKRRCKLGS